MRRIRGDAKKRITGGVFSGPFPARAWIIRGAAKNWKVGNAEDGKRSGRGSREQILDSIKMWALISDTYGYFRGREISIQFTAGKSGWWESLPILLRVEICVLFTRRFRGIYLVSKYSVKFFPMHKVWKRREFPKDNKLVKENSMFFLQYALHAVGLPRG